MYRYNGFTTEQYDISLFDDFTCKSVGYMRAWCTVVLVNDVTLRRARLVF